MSNTPVHRSSLIWLLAWLLFGGTVWFAAHRPAKPNAKSRNTNLSSVSNKESSGEIRQSSDKKRLKSIERIQVGERVATNVSQEIRSQAIGDPLKVPKWDQLDQDVDSNTWRKLILAMYTPEGDRFDITLLRPIDWIESCNAQVGAPIHLVVSEQGLDGLADVLAIEPCPTISSSIGRVVTGTFTHVRGGILRIKLAGLEEPIGVTSNHSIYSVDRSDFVPAGELQVGESLRQLNGKVQIESIEELSTEERVYNLEIQGEHVFHVAASGVLVHNSSGSEPFANVIYRHYTNAEGYAAISESGVIRARNGKAYVTQDALNPTEAFNSLFIGNPRYAGKGNYVFEFTLKPGVKLNPGTQINEQIHFGSLRFGRNVDIIFSGPNPY